MSEDYIFKQLLLNQGGFNSRHGAVSSGYGQNSADIMRSKGKNSRSKLGVPKNYESVRQSHQSTLNSSRKDDYGPIRSDKLRNSVDRHVP